MVICTKCKLSKPKTEFYKDKRKTNGCFSWCISCRKKNQRITSIKYLVRDRGYDFDLSDNDIIKIIESVCFYCGSKPQYFNGVDRVDNAKGYTKDNTVSCCWYCNLAKGKLNKTDFLNHIKKIYDYSIANPKILNSLAGGG